MVQLVVELGQAALAGVGTARGEFALLRKLAPSVSHGLDEQGSVAHAAAASP